MRIIRPYARMMNPFSLTDFSVYLKHVDWCGRISHRSEDAPSDSERFLRAIVMGKGDWSIVEHVSISVDAIVDRGITHEIVRHRIASYTQESTRFVNYQKKMPPSFIYPIPGVECPDCLSHKEGCDEFSYANINGNWKYEHLVAGGTDHGGTQYPCCYDGNWLHAIFEAEAGYKRLLAKGWKPQDARSVFPNALASRIIITMNLRTWRHFFLMRTSKEAHPQMRQVMIPLLREFQAAIPVLYDDIEPEMRQIDNICKGK